MLGKVGQGCVRVSLGNLNLTFYIYIYRILNLFEAEEFFIENLSIFIFELRRFSCTILKKRTNNPKHRGTILEPFKGNLYRSLEIFSNHVNNSGGAHSPAEHSPTTAPLSDASLSPTAVIVSTDDRGIWKRGSLATRRRKFRSLFARVSQKNGDESAPAD